MNRCKSHIVAIMMIFTGIIVTENAAADDIDVYESLTDITIGRVFLSPEQRLRLDGMRGKTPSVTSADRGKSRQPNTRAAGYIVSSAGKLKVWSNGDFVASDDRGQMRFPGDVRVIRKTVQQSDTNSPDPADASLPDSGAVDDEE